ncbi:surface lipoprotein assembly modifier [Pandoraea captiosa]|nr:tetratricopeptide repeat protein [Pandoraea captiosa]
MSVLSSSRRVIVAAAVAVVMTSVAHAADTSAASGANTRDPAITQARAFMKAKSPEEAYAVLAPLEGRLAGDAEYDYLLGIAAADTRHLDVAERALKRTVAQRPGDGPARLELARVYFALGQREDARREFESVASGDVPEGVRPVIQAYLNAIDVPVGERTAVTGYVQGNFGRDTNANNATTNSSIAIPSLGGLVFVLDGTARGTPANFGDVSGGVLVRHAVTDHLVVSGGADFDIRRYGGNARAFDQGSYTLQLGANWLSGPNNFGVQYVNQHMWLDAESYRNLNGFSAQWTRDLGNGLQAAAFGQYTPLRYMGTNVRDVNRAVGGASVVKGFSSVYGAPVVFASMYGGRESPKDGNAAAFGNDLWGGRTGGEWHVMPNQVLFASVSFERRDYDTLDSMFLVERRDRQLDVRAGYSYFVTKAFSITPQYSFTRNRSSLTLYDYHRSVYEIVARYDFR